MRLHVAFTPAEVVEAPVAVVVDVLRSSSTIAQALASGYRRVLCCGAIDEARALRGLLAEGVLAGERRAVRVPGFDLGVSPMEYLEPRAETVVLSTTNGTQAILTAATTADEVLLGSILNLGSVADAVRARGRDTVVVCAGFQGTFALDDAYCAGRIVQAPAGERTDAAIAAELVARAFPTPHDAFEARTYGLPGLEDDIAWCARESVLSVVPRFARLVGGAAELVA